MKERLNLEIPLGRIVLTRGAIGALEERALSPWQFLNRHRRCDWGEAISGEDWEYNNQAVKDGSRLLSFYTLPKSQDGETEIWVITEWDRSATTLLLPSEY